MSKALQIALIDTRANMGPRILGKVIGIYATMAEGSKAAAEFRKTIGQDVILRLVTLNRPLRRGEHAWPSDLSESN